MSRLQRNIIIVVFSGLCIILLLWIPSNQSTEDAVEKEVLPNHIQITPLREQNSNDLATNEGRKQKGIDDLVQQANNKQISNLLGDQSYKDSDTVDNSVVANNVIDNIENIQNNAIDGDGKAKPLTFKGPTNERQRAVVAAAQHAWAGYKKYAWGHDNLKPISMGSHDWFGLALTLVDALDTLYIMNLREGMANV